MEIVVKEINVKGVMTKSNLPWEDYSVNPYVGCAHACKYCYASFMKRFTNHLEPWGTFVDVKTWPEIKHPEKYAGKRVFLGSVTDPYQPCEEKFKRTRKLLEELKDSGIHLTIATKSDLILRDLDLLKTFPHLRISWSINTLDEEFRCEMDDGVSIERRLAAMKKFYDAGIQTTCFMSPVFPGITNVKEIILAAKDRCNLVWVENLNLRGDYKARIIEWIHANRPQLDELYREIYGKKKRGYWQELDENIKFFAKEEHMRYVRNDDSIRADFGELPIIVNYFFHEEIVPSAQRNSNVKK